MRWILSCMLALSGCTGTDDGADDGADDRADDGADHGVDGADRDTREDALSEASLGHNGAEDGMHEESAHCADGTGQLSGGGSIDAGSVTISVTDGMGTMLYTATYDDAWEGEGEAFEGQAGDWTLSADRTGGFDGQYSFLLACS